MPPLYQADVRFWCDCDIALAMRDFGCLGLIIRLERLKPPHPIRRLGRCRVACPRFRGHATHRRYRRAILGSLTGPPGSSIAGPAGAAPGGGPPPASTGRRPGPIAHRSRPAPARRTRSVASDRIAGGPTGRRIRHSRTRKPRRNEVVIPAARPASGSASEAESMPSPAGPGASIDSRTSAVTRRIPMPPPSNARDQRPAQWGRCIASLNRNWRSGFADSNHYG
jgi:hypothetical protein